MGDQVTCEHVGCADIQKELDGAEHGSVARRALEGVDDDLEQVEPSYEVGKADFNGNVQIPSPGQNYMVVLNNNDANYYMQFTDSNRVNLSEVCGRRSSTSVSYTHLTLPTIYSV